MATPSNTKLYEQVKPELYKKSPVHSAYGAALPVNTYKKCGARIKAKEINRLG